MIRQPGYEKYSHQVPQTEREMIISYQILQTCILSHRLIQSYYCWASCYCRPSSSCCSCDCPVVVADWRRHFDGNGKPHWARTIPGCPLGSAALLDLLIPRLIQQRTASTVLAVGVDAVVIIVHFIIIRLQLLLKVWLLLFRRRQRIRQSQSGP